jgi:hypothetical protein
MGNQRKNALDLRLVNERKSTVLAQERTYEISWLFGIR